MSGALQWAVPDRFETSAGTVAAGSAGTGPALVLAHGWPWSSFSWHRVIPELAQRFHVHWYDMPGYGRSSMGANQTTGLDVQGAVFAEMLSHWGLERPHVVAHDFGGATTLRAHVLHGCAYDRTVLMNVVALSPWGSDFFTHVGRHVDAFTGLPDHIHAAVAEAYIRGALVSELPADDVAGLVAPWLTAEGRVSFYRQFAQADEAFTDAIEPRLGDVEGDVLVVWGEADPWIPIDRGRRLHAMLPDAALLTLPGVGHLPQLEAPAALAPILMSFLADGSVANED